MPWLQNLKMDNSLVAFSLLYALIILLLQNWYLFKMVSKALISSSYSLFTEVWSQQNASIKLSNSTTIFKWSLFLRTRV